MPRRPISIVTMLSGSKAAVGLGPSHAFDQYTTSIKRPLFGRLSKFLLIVNMEISSPDSDLSPKP